MEQIQGDGQSTPIPTALLLTIPLGRTAAFFGITSLVYSLLLLFHLIRPYRLPEFDQSRSSSYGAQVEAFPHHLKRLEPKRSDLKHHHNRCPFQLSP